MVEVVGSRGIRPARLMRGVTKALIEGGTS